MLWKAGAAAAAIIFAGSLALAEPAKPTDAEIAHIAYTAGEIDIKAADLALKRSKNKEVLGFAEVMLRDHKAVNEQALALVKKLNVTPKDNETSKALLAQADDKLKVMATLDGPAFDKAYAERELAYHKAVNEAVANTLIPSASNPELKSLLTTGLKIFQGHEQHAAQVVKALK